MNVINMIKQIKQELLFKKSISDEIKQTDAAAIRITIERAGKKWSRILIDNRLYTLEPGPLMLQKISARILSK